MLAGGVASATVSGTPQSVAAYDETMFSEDESTEESDYFGEDDEEEDYETDSESYEETLSASDEEDSSEEETDENVSDTEDADASGESAPESSEAAAGTESGTSGTESGTSGTESGAAGTESGTSSTESGTTGTEGDGAGETVPDDGLTEEERRLQEEEEARRKAEEEAKAAEEAQQAEMEAAAEADEKALIVEEEQEAEDAKKREAQAAADAEDAKKRKEIEDQNREASEKLRDLRDAELRKEEEEEEEKKKKEEELAEARRAGYASYISGYASSSRFYTGTYFVSEAQRRLALNLGFKQVAKKYAIPANGYVNIREGRNEDARIVGVLEAGSLCFILDDGNDAWSFVESGDVRGFVKTDLLTRGTEVDQLVEKTGESRMRLAVQKIDPLENEAYRYTLTTTKDVSALMSNLVNSSVSRDNVVQFARQFIGNPVVWGGNSLTSGTDCSGLTQQVYAHFGISIPRVSYEQAKSGVRIPVSEAMPGDLIFYARNGVVYHVVLYTGDGKAVNAGSTTSGIVLSNVDYDNACWACRFIDDNGENSGPSTQASQLVATGREAYDGDEASKAQIIEALAQASEKEWEEIGFCRSVLIAQTIEESGWLAFHNTGSGIQATDNNVLGMNVDLLNDRWISPWSGASISRLVPQYVNGQIVYGFEDMRVYQDIESCMVDYAAFKIGLHPELRGVNDIDAVIDIGLRGYATNPAYKSNIKLLIDKYDLTKYDKPFVIDDDDTVVNGEEGVDYTADGSTESVPEDLTPEALNPDSFAEIPETIPEDPESFPELPEAEEEESFPEIPETTPEEQESYPEYSETVPEEQESYPEYSEDEYEDGSEPDSEDSYDFSGEFIPEDAGNGSFDASGEGEADEVFGESYDDTDAVEVTSDTYRSDNMNYTPAQMELIWAIVAEEDDISYDGALAVISAAMNRADQNFGGFGRTAYDQLTADGQYCYSPSVADPIYYQRRLGGNVPDFVKQAVEDCLRKGIRSHSYNTFSSTSVAGGVLIGSNWYFNAEAPEMDDFFYDSDDDEFVFDEGYEDGDYIFDESYDSSYQDEYGDDYEEEYTEDENFVIIG